MSPRDAVLQQALTLPDEDRAFLADALERSLSSAVSDPDEVAWFQELDRRIEAYRRGDTKAVSFEESLQNLRRTLAEHRAYRAIGASRSIGWTA